MNRHELTAYLANLKFDQASNIKFYGLLWTRLVEEGIPQDDATKIASTVRYDFSNVPEDDDSLSEFATEYASYAERVYHVMKNVFRVRDITPLLKYFDVIELKIDSL